MSGVLGELHPRRGLSGRASGLRRPPIYWFDPPFGGCTTIRTRRLSARPSGDALSATGFAGPKPCAVTRSNAMPCETRKLRTASARCCDKVMLKFFDTCGMGVALHEDLRVLVLFREDVGDLTQLRLRLRKKIVLRRSEEDAAGQGDDHAARLLLQLQCDAREIVRRLLGALLGRRALLFGDRESLPGCVQLLLRRIELRRFTT